MDAEAVHDGSGKVPAMSDMIAMLERISLFAGTDRVTLERIAELTEEEEVAAGTTLTHEGRHEGYFYMIVAGTVEVSRGGVVIDTSGSGGFVGEISLLDLGPRTATATTITPCLLLKVNSQGFEALLEADPSVREALEAEMARRLERLDAEGRS
jgi:CRP-like cAMP-binding protein